MPEGPECKIVSEELSKIIKNKILTKFTSTPSGRYRNGDLEKMVRENVINSVKEKKIVKVRGDVLGKKVVKVESWGKLIIISLEGEIFILVTLGMTGNFTNFLADNFHTSLILEFSKENEQKNIYFNDKRHFGTFSIGDLEYLKYRTQNLGMDIFDKRFNTEYLTKVMKNNKDTTNICVFLMNQKNLAGVGNYLKCEALYMAEIKPTCQLKNLSQDDIDNLAKSITKIAKNSYRAGGLSMRDFIHLDGTEGGYLKYCNVYNKEKDPTGISVKKMNTPDSRTTWYV